MIRLNNTTYTYIFTYNNIIKPRNFIDVNETTETTQEINSIYALVKEKYIVLSNSDEDILQEEYNKRNGSVGDTYTKDELDNKITKLSLALDPNAQISVKLSKVDRNLYGVTSSFFNNGDIGYIYVSKLGIKGEVHLDVFVEYVATNTFTKVNTVLLNDKNYFAKVPVTLETSVDTQINVYLLPKGETYKGSMVGMTTEAMTLFSVPKIPTTISTFTDIRELSNPVSNISFAYFFDVDYSGKDITFECDVEGVNISLVNSQEESYLNNNYFMNINANVPDGAEIDFSINVDGLSTTGKIKLFNVEESSQE